MDWTGVGSGKRRLNLEVGRNLSAGKPGAFGKANKTTYLTLTFCLLPLWPFNSRDPAGSPNWLCF